MSGIVRSVHAEISTFTLAWNDKQKELSISNNKGNFPGMLKRHTFNIIMVDGKHGSGPLVASSINNTVDYEGKAIVVKLK